MHTTDLPPEAFYPELVTFTHHNPNPVLLLDAEGHVRYLNLAARQMQQEMGLTDADILKVLPANLIEVVRQCLDCGTQARRLESQIQDRWFGWSAYGVPGGQTVYFHGADITQYKRVEKEQNELWKQTITTELDQINEYKTFRILEDHEYTPTGYKRIPYHFVFDVKIDGRRKARLVAGGHRTDPPKEDTYSGVVSLEGVRIGFLLAHMNKLMVCTGDVGNAFLYGKTWEKVFVIAGH